MEQIINNLYLGSFAEVQDIKSNPDGFVACLTVGKEFSISDVPRTQVDDLKIVLPDLNLIGISHKKISIEDTTDNVICRQLPKAMSFIDANISKGKVYVHCFAGVSRSASIVYAYLLFKGYSPIKAFEILTSQRGRVCPYYNFMVEILKYFKIPNQDRILNELKSGLYMKPGRS